MNGTATIFQCVKCLRFFSAGEVVSVSCGAGLALVKAGGLQTFDCGRADCADCAAENQRRDAARRRGRREQRSLRTATGGGHPANVRSSCPPERDLEFPAGAVGPGLAQHEFVASGKADSANDRLLEFFEHALRTGQMRVPFSRKFLKEICGNDYINNRIDDLREIFAPRGIKLQNIEYSPSEAVPKSSHYWLVLMSDAEFAEFERTRNPPC